MKTSEQDRHAIGLGYAIIGRLNRRCVRRDEIRIDAAIAAIAAHMTRRMRLLGQFNACNAHNVKARLNRQLCTMDSTIEKLTQRAQEIEAQELYNVRDIKEARIIVKKCKGRKHKSQHVVTLVTERVPSIGRTLHVTGTPVLRIDVPSYMGGIAPIAYGQYIGTIPITPGMTGYNEIYPKASL